MTATWPHDRLGPLDWARLGSDHGYQTPSSVASNPVEGREQQEGDQPSTMEIGQADQSATATRPETGIDNADTIEHQQSPKAQDPAALEAHDTNPSISVSAETPLPTTERSENGDNFDDSMDIDGSAIDDDEDVSGDQAEGDSTTTEKTAAERWADKRKMKRFRLTHNQTRFLMSEFSRQAHPDAAQRERLSREIPGLSPRQVQVWFQNRRAKLKRLTIDDRERMMRSRALPDDFDMAKALHSPLRGGPVHTLPRPYSTPAASFNDNSALGGLAALHTAPRSIGHDGNMDNVPSPLSSHPDYSSYAHSASSGTVSGNQSPTFPTAMSSYARSSYNYRPYSYSHSGSLPNALYPQQPPRSVSGLPEHMAGGGSGRSSPTSSHVSYVGTFDNNANGLPATSMPAALAPHSWGQAYAAPTSTANASQTLAPHHPLLDQHGAQQIGRMRSRTSPSSHPAGYPASTPPAVYQGPYSAPLAPSQGTGPRAQNPGAPYVQPYNSTENRPGASPMHSPVVGQAPSYAGYYASLAKQSPRRYYEPARSAGSATPPPQGATTHPTGLGLMTREDGSSEQTQGAEAA